MAKKSELPNRGTLIDIVKKLPIPGDWEVGADVRLLEKECDELREKLLADKRLVAMEKRIEKARSLHRKNSTEKRRQRADLLMKVKLADVTPALVAEVRKFAGIK